MQALTRAADRGVKVRIYLDGTQLAEREPAKVFNDLAETTTTGPTRRHSRTATRRLGELMDAQRRTVGLSEGGPPTKTGVPKTPLLTLY
jgi:hypothetical protein